MMDDSFVVPVWWAQNNEDYHADCEVFYDGQGPYKVITPWGVDVIDMMGQFSLDLLFEAVNDLRGGRAMYDREIARDL